MSRSTVTVFTIEVIALEGCALPWFPGHETRAGFLAAVRRVDGGLAEALHSGVKAGVRGRRAIMSLKALRMMSGVRWVRVEDSGRSPLREGLGARAGFKALIQPGGRGWFSVAILDDGLAGRAFTIVPALIDSEVTVGDCRFKAASLKIEVVDPNKVFEDAPSDWECIDTYFKTPTYLNPLRGDARYKILYPDVTALLANLIATAKYVTGRTYPKPEELATHTYVSGLDIRTPRTKVGNEATPTGFIGWVRLRPRKETPKNIRKLTAALLKLGELTNIGGNRSAGYGEVKTKINTKNNKHNNKPNNHTTQSAPYTNTTTS